MYYHPVQARNISICGTADMTCMENVDLAIRKQKPGFTCSQCLPGCFSLNYESTFSTARIFHQMPFLRERKLDPANMAIVYIFYPQSTFRTQKMDELVSFTDFLCMFFMCKHMSSSTLLINRCNSSFSHLANIGNNR